MRAAGVQPQPASGARAGVGAIRPKTLGASLCPVAMGAGLAWHEGAFAWMPVVAALAGAGLLQVASNLANDLFDGLRGTDSGARIGPERAVASGAISARAMAVALVLALAAAAVPAASLSMHAGAWFAVIGVAGVLDVSRTLSSTARSMRPSPSKSPAATLFQNPRSSESRGKRRSSAGFCIMLTAQFHSPNWPASLRKQRSGPASQASTRSGSPSSSRSVNTAPLTMPTAGNSCASDQPVAPFR